MKRKATTIEKVKDLNTYTLDELIENLQSYEVQLKANQQKVKDKKRKDIAFTTQSESDSSFEEEFDDILMLAKKFKKMW
jgi:gamma-glutamyl phosphate reductase